jgi:hypothetical protein
MTEAKQPKLKPKPALDGGLSDAALEQVFGGASAIVMKKIDSTQETIVQNLKG